MTGWFVYGLVIGAAAGWLARRPRPATRATLTIHPAPAVVAVLRECLDRVQRITEGNGMRVKVQIGEGGVTLDAWRNITLALLDQVGRHVNSYDRDAVARFIGVATRAWPDLEAEAKRQNPDATAPRI